MTSSGSLNAGEHGFWRDRSVLVTGATGLIGSHLCEALIERGARVVALVRDHVPSSLFARHALADKTALVRGDCIDFAVMRRTLAEYEVDLVFHLAAQTLVGVARADPLGTFESNIAGTYRLLEAARLQPRPPSVVVASSDKAYGASPQLPYTEETPLAGRGPYDVSKSCADLLAQAYAATYELPVSITRCGNFYGPGDLNWNRIVPGTIAAALRGQEPLIRSNGQPRRDFLFAADGVSAYLTLGRALSERPGELRGRAFNFGTNEPITVEGAVREILVACDRPDLEPRILDLEAARGEIADQSLDATRAELELNWRAAHSFASGLRATVPWYRELLSR